MNARTHIPVADAPLADFRPAEPTRSRLLDRPESVRPDDQPNAVYLVSLVLFSLFVTMQVFKDGDGAVWPFLVYVQYLLWPFIVVTAAIHLARNGPDQIWRATSFVAPFFAIGVVSALFGYNHSTSGRMLVFWLLLVVAAATAGAELRPSTVRSVLFWAFLAMLATSAALALAVPEIGLMTTGVGKPGTWRGAFPGKNWLGYACDFALIATLFARGTWMGARLAMLGLIVACLFFADSQGAVVGAVAVLLFVVTVGVLRRSRLSSAFQATLLFLGMSAAGAALHFGTPLLLELLGRDATLTGRTTIWAAYLSRAADFWLIGAGPGSFTSLSYVTWDIGIGLSHLGWIRTPHNMFIAAFGEVGIFGLIAFVLPIGYAAFVLPFVSRRTGALPAAAVAFLMIVGGMVETHEVFGQAPGMFILILLIAALHREERDAGASDAGLASSQAVATDRGPAVLGIADSSVRSN